MKTAVVLNGCSPSLDQQIEEINGFLSSYLSSDFEIEVWILTHQKINKAELKGIIQTDYIGLVQTNTGYLPEDFLDALQRMFSIRKPELIVFGSSSYAKELSARLAYRLKGSSCIGVNSCRIKDGKFLVEKEVYSNHLTARFILKKVPCCISITKGFRTERDILECLPEFEVISGDAEKVYSWIKSYHSCQKENAAGLETASVVVAVGRGIGCKENIGSIAAFAESMNAKLGASRPVVMSAWTEMDKLIGASGTITAPSVCIALGISGAAAFAVGIEKSTWIVAVNKDEKAPIFKMADIGIIDDYNEVVQELTKLLSKK
ncbi:electron transfer flavoprotein subunit alpha/FixB family protein [Geosporobacter ferrireducens]|uniref:electron transfer flavoprotein subunit alpha/FixB family protein n=1 Tax=Geosporobacter ferrireducens TaxID=1424294 RepID=UPI00139BE026|nr:electron transfer flavoprotein subunit alpha/FixB family protein [Geosporobacter ferrireducens]MTI54868.1 electron transfer flavoprotein subunit alpha/FixB family protein [Geosporobacter ferrireducens]